MSEINPRHFEEQQLISRLREGDDGAFREFLGEYGDSLHQLAERRLGAEFRRRLGPEDVVQSVCRTFFRRAKQGEFDLSDTNSVWRLLCVITVMKAREQKRFHGRHRRSVFHEQHLDSVDANGSFVSQQATETTSSPQDLVELEDQLEHIVSALDPEERQILDLRLQGHNNAEVAEALKCSQRTVRRMMHNVRLRLEQYFEVD